MNFEYVLDRFKADRFIQVVFACLIGLLLMVLFAGFFLPDPQTQDLAARLQPPSGDLAGIMGTDSLGRSVSSLVVAGLRTTVLVGAGAALLGFAGGTIAGVCAGYFGGFIDWLVMRMVEIQMSLPGLLLIAVTVITVGGGTGVLTLILGFLAWPVYARLSRSLVLRMKTTDFVTSSRSIGCSSPRIVFRHLFPNVFPSMIAMITLELPALMVAEASLSFIGYGVQSPTVSIGTVLQGGRAFLYTQWWITTFAGLGLVAVVLCMNLLGSWLERVTDPTAVDQPQDTASPALLDVTAKAAAI